jgi:dihydrofolate reductase
MAGSSRPDSSAAWCNDMVKLIYIANVSLDGFIEDPSGSFEWTAPDEDAFAFITDLVRPVGTYLYGRRLYETMAVWETDDTLAAQSEPMAGLREGLAGGGQGRVLHDPAGCVDSQDPARAQLRPRRSGRHEAVGHH